MNELSVRARQWKKDLAELESMREGFWGYVAAVIRIRDSKSYLEVYATFEEFLENHVGWKKSTGYQFMEACEVRQTLSAIADKAKLPSAESHLRELAKIPDDAVVEVFAEVSQQCEQEQREPTAKDYRKAAAKFVPAKSEPKPEPARPAPDPADWGKLKAGAIRYGEAFVRAIDDLHAAKRFHDHKKAVACCHAAMYFLRGEGDAAVEMLRGVVK